jgi:hypothetical protein
MRMRGSVAGPMLGIRKGGYRVRCGDCRWWGSVAYAVPSRPGQWRSCQKSVDGVLSCLSEDAAVYDDGLITEAAFGCVEFEPRDDDAT